MVDVNGGKMHIRCEGTGSPTVVLEAGATGFSGTWAWVQANVAKETRVCSYDRRGLGWSLETEGPRDGEAIARELKELLDNAGEKGPYVMAGHSLGGVFIRIFQTNYPDSVSAMVFVDSSHPDQLERFPSDFVKQFRDFVTMIGWAPMVARFGVLRATNLVGGSAAGLPEDDYNAAVAFGTSIRHLRTSGRELAEWDRTMGQARASSSLGEMPISAISATIMPDAPEGVVPINHEMHRELARLSSRGDHLVVDGSDHFNIVMNEANAKAVAGEIIKIVRVARALK